MRNHPSTCLYTFDVASLLPAEDDLLAVRTNFVVLISRVLVKFIPALKQLESVVEKHIQHQFSREMSQHSEVVSVIFHIVVL